MHSKERAWSLLGIVAVCLLVAEKLPTWQKLWFVTETGNISSNSTLTVLLLMGLFLRWRLARPLLIGLTLLGVIIPITMLFLAVPGHMVGYPIAAALHLVALLILNSSADIKHYLAEGPYQTTTPS